MSGLKLTIVSPERELYSGEVDIVLAPGIALTVTVLAFNLFGDGLRDALDPRLNR